MAFDEELDRRVEGVISSWGDTCRKKMFGGVCYLLRGNMVAGALGDELILRLGAAEAAEALQSPGVKVFDLTGRPMKGWVTVSAERLRTDAELRAWLDRARRFVEALPTEAKPP